VGDDAGKLTATGAAQKRHARDWGKFLLKANKEVTSGEWRVTRVEEKNSTTNQINLHENGEKVSTTDNTDGHGCQKSQPGNAHATCAGASESDFLTSKLFESPVSESLTRYASAPASLPTTSCSLTVTRRPSAWFGFRRRAYEAWWDLEKFFPEGEGELKKELQEIWRRSVFSGIGFRLSGFVLRKWGGMRSRIFGHRVKGCFRPGKFTSRVATLFDNR